MFDLKATDKYHELCSFEIEVKNNAMPNNYDVQESKRN